MKDNIREVCCHLLQMAWQMKHIRVRLALLKSQALELKSCKGSSYMHSHVPGSAEALPRHLSILSKTAHEPHSMSMFKLLLHSVRILYTGAKISQQHKDTWQMYNYIHCCTTAVMNDETSLPPLGSGEYCC
jgi:hypothetical protein